MKKLILGIIGTIALAIGSIAQTYDVQSVAGLPATIDTASTSNVLATIDVRKAENVALQYKWCNGGTGTGNVTLTFKYSVDGITFADAPTFTWVLAATADTTFRTFSTNFATTGYGYLQLATIASAAGSTMTNSSLKYSVKLLTKE